LTSISRGRFIAASAASAAFAGIGLLRFPADAAEFTIKIGLDLPADHPTSVNLVNAANAINRESNGRLAVQVFPAGQLGSDEQMLSQVRSGAIQMMSIGDNILATLVPAAAVNNIGFAWKTPQAAHAALDAQLGGYVRGQIEKSNLFAFEKIWDQGFRQMTSATRAIRTPDDLKGFKMRVPPSPISTSLVKSLGASPTTINFNELYSALQTHLVDGQENPLSNIETQKFYEVQKYCSITNHMWVGYWLVANGDFWKRLPNDLKAIVDKNVNASALAQRKASIALNDSLAAKLKSQGMVFNTTSQDAFRTTLVKNGFFKQWRSMFGDQAWKLLEKYTGPLA
jgi:tripartite ATP-independent transporter DctP family solute receptor